MPAVDFRDFNGQDADVAEFDFTGKERGANSGLFGDGTSSPLDAPGSLVGRLPFAGPFCCLHVGLCWVYSHHRIGGFAELQDLSSYRLRWFRGLGGDVREGAFTDSCLVPGSNCSFGRSFSRL